MNKSTSEDADPYVRENLYYILQLNHHWIRQDYNNPVLTYLFNAFIGSFFKSTSSWERRGKAKCSESARKFDSAIRTWLQQHGLMRKLFVHVDEVQYIDPIFKYLSMEVEEPIACSKSCTKATCPNVTALMECDKRCKGRNKCNNQDSQSNFSWSDKLEVVFINKAVGVGLKAKVSLGIGEYLGQYTGEALSHEECSSKQDSKYIFQLSKEEDYCPVWAIDSSYYGNYCRFVNHSCDPNSESEIWIANGFWIIKFKTKRAIMPVSKYIHTYI